MNADCKREWCVGDEGYIITAPVQMFPFKIEPVSVEQVINPIYGVVNVRVKADDIHMTVAAEDLYSDYESAFKVVLDDVRERINLACATCKSVSKERECKPTCPLKL